MKQSKSKKRFWDMSADELAVATREFDKPIPASRLKPGTNADRARLQRALRAGSYLRPFDQLGLDPQLLSEAAAYAKKKKIPLGRVVERGLRRELAVKD